MLPPPQILDASVLIVDDHAPNVQLLTYLLGAKGYTRVSSTMQPQTVCALHRANRYDLILLDLEMPGMDGFQVMEALKAEEEGAHLPVIVLTAEASYMRRALQAGARDFICKPFDLVDVTTRIRNMLEARLLYTQPGGHQRPPEQAVQERTAARRESEAR